MLKYWTATSLLALALLGCFVDQGVEAQRDAVLQPRLSIASEKPKIPWNPNQRPNTGQTGTPVGLNPLIGHGLHLGSNPNQFDPSKLSKPPATQGQWNPSTSQGQWNPSTSQGQWKPSTSQGQSNPSTSQGQWNPSTSQGQSNPSTSQGQWKPSTSHGQWNPSTSQGQSNPSTSQGQWNPSTSQGQWKPSTSQGQSNPSTSHGQWNPSTSQGQLNPPVTHGKPKKPGFHGQSNPFGSHGPSFGQLSPPGSGTGTKVLNPPSWQTKNPSVSQNNKNTKILPRTSPPSQKQHSANFNPSQSGLHLIGAAKNPSQDTCNVHDNVKIQCGHSDEGREVCHARGCCFDGSFCYYGKAVTVQCTKGGLFVVVIAKDATLPHVDFDSVSWLGSGNDCGVVDRNSEFSIYNFAVTDCGTIVREEDIGIIIYENRMTSFLEIQDGPTGQITRDTLFDVQIECRYTAQATDALVIELLLSDPFQPVSSLGPVTVLMQLGNGECSSKGCDEVAAAYTSFYTRDDYPVAKILKEPVYVQVEILDTADPLVVLTLDHCWTTASPNPHDFPQWDLLINGCPNPSDPYQTVVIPELVGGDIPVHYRRFYFKMFAFTDSVSATPHHQQVYIHCSTSLCLYSPGSRCEPNCFTKLKKREAPIKEKRTEPNVVVTTGPVTISGSEV